MYTLNCFLTGATTSFAFLSLPPRFLVPQHWSIIHFLLPLALFELLQFGPEFQKVLLLGRSRAKIWAMSGPNWVIVNFQSTCEKWVHHLQSCWLGLNFAYDSGYFSFEGAVIEMNLCASDSGLYFGSLQKRPFPGHSWGIAFMSTVWCLEIYAPQNPSPLLFSRFIAFNFYFLPELLLIFQLFRLNLPCVQ